VAACSKNQSGQSLVEVIVAVGMMALLLVAILALVALSVKNSRLAKTRNQAVALAQEGIELMRTYRDYSWTELMSRANGTVFDLPDNWIIANGLTNNCPSDFPINSVFRRCVSLNNTTGAINVLLTVAWQEGAKIYQTEQTTQLSLW
jgi:type II secretory pathway pseudopilin PulG